MLLGFLFSGFFSCFSPLTPYMIFVMLFITFCRITPDEMKFTSLHFILLCFQVLAGILIYFGVRNLDETAAQGVMICVLAPTAVSSVVIGGMLGANVGTMATFTLLSNITTAIAAPLFFSFIGANADIAFSASFARIFSRVVPVLVIPFIIAFLLRKAAPRIHEGVKKIQIVSFYIWSFALMIVTGQTVEFIKARQTTDYRLEIYIAIGALSVCVVQFLTGRFIGGKYKDKIAGGQSLGQKNTILAIWMSQTYLDPLSSIGPASYVLWQNIVNSWQLWRARGKADK